MLLPKHLWPSLNGPCYDVVTAIILKQEDLPPLTENMKLSII
jgi:hypothetical protein